MAATQIGVVYGIVSKTSHDVIIPDDDAELDTYPLGPGFAMLKLPHVPRTWWQLDQAVAQALGVADASPLTSVVVVGGVAVKRIPADPALTTIPNATLVADRQGQIAPGDRWNGSYFVRPQQLVDWQGNYYPPRLDGPRGKVVL